MFLKLSDDDIKYLIEQHFNVSVTTEITYEEAGIRCNAEPIATSKRLAETWHYATVDARTNNLIKVEE